MNTLLLISAIFTFICILALITIVLKNKFQTEKSTAVSCPNNCSFKNGNVNVIAGTCNTKNGVCTCKANYYSPDCSITYSNIHVLALGPASGYFISDFITYNYKNPSYYTRYSTIKDLSDKWSTLKNALIYIYYSNESYASSLEGQTSLYNIFNLLTTKFVTEGLTKGKETNTTGNRVMLILDIKSKTIKNNNIIPPTIISTAKDYFNLFAIPINNTTNKYATPPSTLLKQITLPYFPYTNNTQTDLLYLIGWTNGDYGSVGETIKDTWSFSMRLFRSPPPGTAGYLKSFIGGNTDTRSIGRCAFDGCTSTNKAAKTCNTWCFSNKTPDKTPNNKGPALLYDKNYINNIRTIKTY